MFPLCSIVRFIEAPVRRGFYYYKIKSSIKYLLLTIDSTNYVPNFPNRNQ